MNNSIYHLLDSYILLNENNIYLLFPDPQVIHGTADSETERSTRSIK